MANDQKNNFDHLLNIVRTNFAAFITGVLVLVLIIGLVFNLSQGNKQKSKQTAAPTKKTSLFNQIKDFIAGKKTQPTKSESKKYVVKEGDHLWKIAEATYGSGYNAYDIAAANKIQNPDQIEKGQELTLPSVAPKNPTRGEVAGAAVTGKVTITGNNYTVKDGDSLWKIAGGAYGDPYLWVKLAQANKIPNPDLIYPGAKLTLPR